MPRGPTAAFHADVLFMLRFLQGSLSDSGIPPPMNKISLGSQHHVPDHRQSTHSVGAVSDHCVRFLRSSSLGLHGHSSEVFRAHGMNVLREDCTARLSSHCTRPMSTAQMSALKRKSTPLAREFCEPGFIYIYIYIYIYFGAFVLEVLLIFAVTDISPLQHVKQVSRRLAETTNRHKICADKCQTPGS